MPISANSMWEKMKAHMAAVGSVQNSNPADALKLRDDIGIAMCQGIVDEIHQNATVPVLGIQAGGSIATGTVQ